MRLLLIVTAMVIASNAFAQTDQKNYYVVVGAFALSKESYAKKFTEQIEKQGLKAAYVQDVKRKYWLVYLTEFDQFDPSIREMLSTRKEGKFPEAWVRIMRGDEMKTEEVKKEAVAIDASPKEEVKPTIKSDSSSSLPIITSSPPKDSAVSSPRPNIPPSPPTPQEIPVVFNMFDANNSRPVDGRVEIVDTQRARLIQENKSTDTLKLPDPKSDSGMLSFITDVFGYRKLQHEVSYKQPLIDSAKHYFDRQGDFYVVQFEMVRYHKGDIATLYNVFFFNDAAIMMPESKYELNKLLDMMQSNKNYRITLHGHTNGNSHGKIISMGPSKDFFNLKAADVKTGTGSAKALSGQRAEVIKEWLVAQGISSDRIEVKAWGGRRMIHDKNSNNARKNVRVEVEVLSE